jgi:hypothetical protein
MRRVGSRCGQHDTRWFRSEIDSVFFQGWAYEDLVTVLVRAGRIDEAREALERLLALWERKGCLPCAARVRDQIASLG